MKTVVIISAAGLGKRMGRPKQFIKIAGKPMLQRTLEIFQKSDSIDGIILVVNAEDIAKTKKFKYSKLIQVVAGAQKRQLSVKNGLKALPKEAEIVLVHDGARPFVDSKIIEESVNAAEKFGAAVVGVPVKDTIKRVTRSGLRVAGTLNRKELWAAQTPQVFKRETLLKAYEDNRDVTDDSSLVEKMGVQVRMVMGSYRNIKITTPDDLIIAEAFIKEGSK